MQSSFVPEAAVMQCRLPTACIWQSVRRWAKGPGASSQRAAVHAVVDWNSMFKPHSISQHAHGHHAMSGYGSIAVSQGTHAQTRCSIATNLAWWEQQKRVQ